MPTRFRLLPPVGATSSTTANGRSYNPAASAYADVKYQDADILEANGWTHVAVVGPTADRPPVRGPSSGQPAAATRGLKYLDTTLAALLVFDGTIWRDALTGAAA